MNLEKLTHTWDTLGREDPFWAVLSDEERKGGRWEPAAFFETGVAEMTQLSVRLEKHRARLGGERALDFGCGVGRITQALTAYFERVDGVDISEAMLKQANRFNGQKEKAHFALNPRSDLSLFGDDTFDLVYSRIVLQHMPVNLAQQYLKEFARVLRPGGVLFFQMPAGWDLTYPQALEELRHSVTFPRKVYKLIRRVVMLDWASPWGRPLEMEMHFLPVSKVAAKLESLGLHLIEVNRDQACGDLLLSYNYLAVRPEQPAARLSNWRWSRVIPPK